jgi:PAS domain S-box-containing protein
MRTLLLGAGITAAYVGAAKLGFDLSVSHGVITPIWAPTGIALASLVLLGVRYWPAVALGALIANATSGASGGEAAAIAVGNTLEAVVGTLLLARVGFRPSLERVRDVLALVVLAAGLSTTVSATNGVTTLLVSGTVPASSYGSEWLLWWIGDAMGALVVAPLILVWATVRPWRLSRRETLEAALLVALLVAVSVLVFLGGLWRYPHLLFPLLVWAPLRFRQPGAVTASFLVTAVAVAGALEGTIPLTESSTTVIVQILLGLLAATAVTMLVLGAVLTERRAAQIDLGRANATLAEAQALAQIGSWEWEIRPNRVTWSDELFRLFGMEPGSADVDYETYLALIHPDDVPLVQHHVTQALEDGRPFEFEHRIALPDGTTRWLHSRGRVLTGSTGAPERMLGTAQDVTDRKRLDELRENILSAVSHELRTPLTTIIGFSITLREQADELDAATRLEIAEHLARASTKLDRLLADLLDLDRLRHGLVAPSFRETNVGELARSVTADYEADGHPVRIQAQAVSAEVDAPKIERILDNLLGNAVKHTPPGTEITVRVEGRGESVLLAVDDGGPGVAEGQRGAIFEVFNRGASVSGHSPGAGIGLSLVAQFAALHHGRAWVEERPGGGASFCVLLPARQAR